MLRPARFALLSLGLLASVTALGADRRGKPAEYQASELTEAERAAARERARNRMNAWGADEPAPEFKFPWMMVGFSVRPLRIIGGMGALFALGGILFGVYRIGQKLWGVDINVGYTSLFSAIVIMGGLQLVALSVIGEYVARIFILSQDRPLFRVSEEINFESP